MGTRITIACLQMSVAWGDEEGNRRKALRAIEQLPADEIRLICLPELFTTGFDYGYLKARDHALTERILEELAEKARARGAYILAGTLPEKEGHRVYNTAFCIGPSGARIASYRKMHLFPLMGEDEFFSPGKSTCVFDTLWARIGIAICFDLRFPELFRSMALAGAQVILVPAQFPASRIDHWDILLRARAIEDQAYLIGINRVGEDPSQRFSGHTAIIDPLGNLVAGGGEEEGWIIGTIDICEVERVRKELPSLFYRYRNPTEERV